MTDNDKPFSEIEAEAIFDAKCDDLCIPPNDSRKRRFLNVFQKNCRGTTFNLSDGGLGEGAAAVIAGILKDNTYYTKINLSGNFMGDGGMRYLTEMLSENKTITEIEFKGNDIGPEGGILLFEMLRTHGYITSADFSGFSGTHNNRMGPKTCPKIAECLMDNYILEKLCLRENGLAFQGCKLLCEGLKENLSLKFLDLNTNNIGVEGVVALAEAMRSPQLEVLMLSRNNIGDEGARSFTDLLRNNPNLKKFDVSHNKLTEAGSKRIASGFKGHEKLEHLDMSHNLIECGGLQYFSDALMSSKPPPLKTWNLSFNRLEEKYLAEFCQSISRLSRLRKLDFSHNMINGDGILAIASAFQFNQCVTNLNVSCNKGGDAGGIALADVLTQNKTLQNLDITDNLMKEPSGDAFLNAVETNSSILSLNHDFNDFSYRAHSYICQKLAQNNRLFRQSAIHRIKKQVRVMNEENLELQEVYSMLDMEKDRRLGLEKVVMELKKQLMEEELKSQKKLDEMTNAYEEKTGMIQKIMNSSNTFISENSKLKTDKEATYRGVLQRLHKEKDLSVKLGKRLRVLDKQLRDQQEIDFQELEVREAENKTLQLSKKQLLMDMKIAQQQINTLKQLLNIEETNIVSPKLENNIIPEKEKTTTSTPPTASASASSTATPNSTTTTINTNSSSHNLVNVH